MKKLKDKLGKDKFSWILLICLSVQLVLIAFCNFTLGEKNIDCDSAKIYVHTIELWRNKTLVLPEWKYASTMVFESAVLFAIPLFGILGNIYYAFAISNMVFVFILLWTITQMFKNKKIIYLLVCDNIILIPYTIGQLDYFNMMFFNYSGYIMKVLLPLMFIAIIVQAEQKEKLKLNQICFSVLYHFFLVICCFSSGIYVFVSGIFPIITGYFA